MKSLKFSKLPHTTFWKNKKTKTLLDKMQEDKLAKKSKQDMLLYDLIGHALNKAKPKKKPSKPGFWSDYSKDSSWGYMMNIVNEAQDKWSHDKWYHPAYPDPLTPKAQVSKPKKSKKKVKVEYLF